MLTVPMHFVVGPGLAFELKMIGTWDLVQYDALIRTLLLTSDCARETSIVETIDTLGFTSQCGHLDTRPLHRVPPWKLSFSPGTFWNSTRFDQPCWKERRRSGLQKSNTVTR